MHDGTKSAVLTMAMFAVCGGVFGQAQDWGQLGKSIRPDELVVSSMKGRADGLAWLRLAILYEDAARYGDAERAFRKAIDFLKTQDRARYADALDQMGVMFVERARFAEAEPLEEKALAIRQDAHDSVGVGRSFMHLSLVAFGRHDLRSAAVDSEMAVSLLDPKEASASREEATPEEKMSALIDVALIRCAKNECGLATADLQRALELAAKNYQANSAPVGFLHFLLGYSDVKNGDVESGAALMKTGTDEMKTQMGWGHPTYVAALKEYEAVLVRAGRAEEAGAVGKSIARLEHSSGAAKTGGEAGLFGVNALR